MNLSETQSLSVSRKIVESQASGRLFTFITKWEELWKLCLEEMVDPIEKWGRMWVMYIYFLPAAFFFKFRLKFSRIRWTQPLNLYLLIIFNQTFWNIKFQSVFIFLMKYVPWQLMAADVLFNCLKCKMLPFFHFKQPKKLWITIFQIILRNIWNLVSKHKSVIYI